MTKNNIIRDIIINELKDDIKNGYQINDNWLMLKLKYWDIDKKLFDKKVTYKTNYDDDYNCFYYTNFQYNY